MPFENEIIRKDIPIPMYYQLKQIILKQIEQGYLRPGDIIHTEQEICEMYDISRTTVRQAIIELANDGYLYRVKGKGTIVNQPRSKLDQDFIQRLEPFNEQMKRLNIVPSTKVLALGITKANEEIAKNLNVSVGFDVVNLKRLRFADTTPIVIVDTYLPESLRDILEADMEQTGLYKCLSAQYATAVVRVKRRLEAVLSDPKQSELLEISNRSAVLLTKTVGFNMAGKPIEFSIAHYTGNKTVFSVELAVVD